MKQVQASKPKKQKNDIQQIEIIDVTHIFSKTTRAYLDFEQNVRFLTNKIPSCTPEQLLDECNLLREERARLVGMDEQMFEIIKFAGEEIVNHPMLSEYRIAFAKADMACTTLSQKIRSLMISLQDTIDGITP